MFQNVTISEVLSKQFDVCSSTFLLSLWFDLTTALINNTDSIKRFRKNRSYNTICIDSFYTAVLDFEDQWRHLLYDNNTNLFQTSILHVLIYYFTNWVIPEEKRIPLFYIQRPTYQSMVDHCGSQSCMKDYQGIFKMIFLHLLPLHFCSLIKNENSTYHQIYLINCIPNPFHLVAK